MKIVNDIPAEIALKMNKEEDIKEIIKKYNDYCFFDKNADIKIKNNILICSSFNNHEEYITSYYNNMGQIYHYVSEYPLFGRYTELAKLNRVIQFKNDHWLTVNVYEDENRLYFNFEKLYHIVSTPGFIIKKTDIKELWNILKRLSVRIDYMNNVYLDLLASNLNGIKRVSKDDEILIELLNNYLENIRNKNIKFSLASEQIITNNLELGSKYHDKTFLPAVNWANNLVDLLDQMVCCHNGSDLTKEKNLEVVRNVYAKLYYSQKIITNNEVDKINSLFKEFGMKSLPKLKTLEETLWLKQWDNERKKEVKPLANAVKYISIFGLDAELDFDFSYIGKIEFGDFHRNFTPKAPKITFDISTNEREGLMNFIEGFMYTSIKNDNDINTEGVMGEIEQCKPNNKNVVKIEMLRFALEALERECYDYIGQFLCRNIIGKLMHGLDLNVWEIKFALNERLFRYGSKFEQLFETEDEEKILEIIL